MGIKRIFRAAMPAVLVLMCGAASADVNVGGDIVVETGETMETAVSIGGTVTVRGTVDDAAVAFGGSVVVENGGRVLGDAVAFGGDIVVRGNGGIENDAVILGGELLIDPGGYVGGERVNIGGGDAFADFGERLSRVIFLGPFAGVFGLFGAAVLLFFFLVRVLLWFAVAALVYHFFPGSVENMAASLRQRFWPPLLYGFLVLVLMPFLFLFLLISILGIPLIPVAAIAVFLIYLYGSVGVALWAGRLLPNSDTRSGMLNVALGILVISLLRLIPGIGLLMWLLLSSLSFGITVTSRFGRQPPAVRTP